MFVCDPVKTFARKKSPMHIFDMYQPFSICMQLHLFTIQGQQYDQHLEDLLHR